MHLSKAFAAVATAVLSLPDFGGTGGIGFVWSASAASVGGEIYGGGGKALRGIKVCINLLPNCYCIHEWIVLSSLIVPWLPPTLFILILASL